MCNYKALSATALVIAMLSPGIVVAAESTITKEDIKRLQINAYAEEMQTEMEKTAITELKSSMQTAPVKIEANLGISAMEEKSIPTEPTVSSR